MILRQKDSYPRDNGVWIATTAQHHSSLREIFPNMRSIEHRGEKEGCSSEEKNSETKK